MNDLTNDNLDAYGARAAAIIAELGLSGDAAIDAAVHLGIGPDLIVGIHSQWRNLGSGVAVDVAGQRNSTMGGLGEVVACAALLSGGRLYDLDGGLGDLVNVARSGAHLVAFGSVSLFGALVVGDDEAMMLAYINAHGANLATDAPTGPVFLDGEMALVDSDIAGVRVWKHSTSSASPPVSLPNTEDYAALGAEIGGMIGCRFDDFVIIGSRVRGVVDLEFLYTDTRSNADVVVASSVADNMSFSVGTPAGAAVLELTNRVGTQMGGDVSVGAHWQVLEQSRVEAGVVAKCTTSGIRALIRQSAALKF